MLFFSGECMSLEIKLSDLLQDIANIDAEHDCIITGIAIDSRVVKYGNLFLAYSGAISDGRDFIAEVIHKGALAVLCEDKLPSGLTLSKTIPVIVVPNLKSKIGLIAAKFYDYPARKLTVIGVTGTNGKTSTTHYIATVLTKLGVACGVIGTIGVGFPGKLKPMINTTSDPVTLQRCLFELNKSGAKAVAMEVSSHGLAHGRVNGIDFSIGVFTNLTRDHLDYHGTMANYGDVKKSLFLQYNLKHAVINADDEFGRGLIQELKDSINVYAYTTSDVAIDGIQMVRAQNIELNLAAISADVATPWGSGLLKSRLLGRFNLSNLLAVLAVLGVMKVDVNEALTIISELEAVNGRMQVFGGKQNKPLVVIDYAHTPDALEQALLTLREYCHGALWCVFGCGGDRDRGKRPIMGKVVERCSDHIIITNDNPRTEDPKHIVDDILQGLLCPWAVEVEYDRMAAIGYAINNAKPDDVILIAGKGHEEYQIIGKEKLPFSDKEVVMKALS